jgi:D-threo-aldose 1-dehydrogenase
MPILPRRRLGRSAVEVTGLSFGAAPLGNLFTPIDDRTARAAVDTAWDEGIRYFDTAPHYGLGLSERRLGEALRERPRSEYALSTKVGRILEPVAQPSGQDVDGGFAVPATHWRRWDFSASGVTRSLADSLDRLGLDRVDLVYLHDPDDHAEQAFNEAYPALERLRAQGVVGAIGVGMNQAKMLTRFVRETDVDVVLLAGRYTLLDQSGLDELLPEAERRGTSVVIGGVFNSGLLANPRRDSTYDYTAVSEEILGRALRMQVVCQRRGVPLRAAALQFPFGHPAVASVLIGARDETEIRDAVEQATTPVPPLVWNELRATGLLPDRAPVPQAAAAASTSALPSAPTTASPGEQ